MSKPICLCPKCGSAGSFIWDTTSARQYACSNPNCKYLWPVPAKKEGATKNELPHTCPNCGAAITGLGPTETQLAQARETIAALRKMLDVGDVVHSDLTRKLANADERAEKAEGDAKRLRAVHTVLASLAGLLQYEAAKRTFFVREADLFRDKTIGQKLCAGKTLLEILNEALAAIEEGRA